MTLTVVAAAVFYVLALVSAIVGEYQQALLSLIVATLLRIVLLMEAR